MESTSAAPHQANAALSGARHWVMEEVVTPLTLGLISAGYPLRSRATKQVKAFVQCWTGWLLLQVNRHCQVPRAPRCRALIRQGRADSGRIRLGAWAASGRRPTLFVPGAGPGFDYRLLKQAPGAPPPS